jgi:hypothetical protein
VYQNSSEIYYQTYTAYFSFCKSFFHEFVERRSNTHLVVFTLKCENDVWTKKNYVCVRILQDVKVGKLMSINRTMALEKS